MLVVDLPKQDRSTILRCDEQTFEHQKQLSRLRVDFGVNRMVVEPVGGEPNFDLARCKGGDAPTQGVEARVVARFLLKA